MRAQRHHRHDPHRRVPAGASILSVTIDAGLLAPEVGPVLLAIGHTDRSAIDAVQRQPAPTVAIRARIGPLGSGALVQPFHRVRAQPCARLTDRARGDGTTAVGAWHREIKLPHHLGNRPIAEQCHPDDEPHDLVRREPTLAQRRGPGRRKRFFDPRRVEMTLKRRVETRRQRGCVGQRFRETHVEIAQDRSRMILRPDRNQTSGRLPGFRSNLRCLPLTDRHCG